MRLMRKQHGENDRSAGNALADDVEVLKENFAQLRADVMEVLNDVAGVGRSGAQIANDGAARAIEGIKHGMQDVKERSMNSAKAVAGTIGRHPLACTLGAFAVGLIAARVLSRR